MPAVPSVAMQDYLKSLYALESQGADDRPLVSTTALAERLSVSPASATSMLKKLEALGLISYVPYKGGALTDAGRKIALEVIRHHRLLETYLAEALGVPWDEVHDEAEVLEHVLSEELEERIAALLGHPDADPHGHPIPDKDGSMPAASRRRLWEVSDGERARVEHVSDEEREALRYLAELEIRPGARLEVVGRGPLAGPLFVKLEHGSEVCALSKQLAEAIWVA